MTVPSYGPFVDGSALLGTLGSFLDQNNQPIGSYTFKNPPVWSVSDATVLALTPAADGTTCAIQAIKPGSVTVTCIGDGVTSTATVAVSASGLGGFTITVVPAPPPPPPSA